MSQAENKYGKHRLDGHLNTINLKVLYKGQPARNYDYTYFNSSNWSNIYSQPYGTGIVENSLCWNARNLQLRTEYMFEGRSQYRQRTVGG